MVVRETSSRPVLRMEFSSLLLRIPPKMCPSRASGYTLGELQLAFALTECAALEDPRQATIRLHLSHGPEKGLKQLSDVVIQAMAQTRGGAG
jgi:hypothetical protein